MEIWCLQSCPWAPWPFFQLSIFVFSEWKASSRETWRLTFTKVSSCLQRRSFSFFSSDWMWAESASTSVSSQNKLSELVCTLFQTLVFTVMNVSLDRSTYLLQNISPFCWCQGNDSSIIHCGPPGLLVLLYSFIEKMFVFLWHIFSCLCLCFCFVSCFSAWWCPFSLKF